MTLLDLLIRWLRHRGGETDLTAAGVRVALAPGDPLTPVLGERFTLLSLPVEAAPPPGVEPVYPGSRITDLLAGDVEQVGGIAVLRAAPGAAPAEPCFVFSFRAAFATDSRVERLIRLALTAGGERAALPPDPAAPLQAAGDGAVWLGRIESLFPAARDAALAAAQSEVGRIERDAQRRLYRTSRRLAAYYGRGRRLSEESSDAAVEYRRRLTEEVERHRLQVSLTLIGVTVVLP